MTIKGFQGTSLLDFPGRLASLVFFSGCNLRCPYCHNPSLLEEPSSLPDYPEEAIFEELERRKGFVDGVVISGGEPTLSPGLLPFLRQVKELGLAVKLDSNGLLPDILTACLDEGLVDYLALDFKTTPARYRELGASAAVEAALRSSLTLIGDRVDGEARTTCVPGLVGEAEIEVMGPILPRESLWVLQDFVPQYAMEPEWQKRSPGGRETLERLRQAASVHVRRVELRGI